MLIDTLRATSALAAMVLVVLYLLMIVRAPGGRLHTRIGLALLDQRGDVPAGDGGGDGGDDGSGDIGDDGSGDGGNQSSQLEQDARAAIDALKAAGAEIPQALSKAVDELAQARKDAGRYRSERNGSATEVAALQEQMKKIAKHLGLEDADPAAVAEAAKQERDTLAAENRSLKVGQALIKAAKAKGADTDALNDSRAFMAIVEKLDPSDDKFTEALEAAVEKAVKDNPKLKAQAVKSGIEFNGGGGDTGKPKTLEEAVAARLAG